MSHKSQIISERNIQNFVSIEVKKKPLLNPHNYNGVLSRGLMWMNGGMSEQTDERMNE